MNFYKRFVGDIQAKTGGLSMAEFGAYDRLLDHYYATEKAIEPSEVYSIARAMSKSDRDAVDKVLRRYFVLDASGNYSQERAEEMIAEAQPKIEAARTNGRRGGRPKKPKPETQDKPTGFSNGTQHEPNAKASQSQNQIPSSLRSEGEARKRADPPPTRPDDVDEQTWRDWLALRKAKRAPVGETTVAGARSEALKAGLTLDRFLAVWCLRGSQGLEADWLKPHERGNAKPQAGHETAWQRSQRETIDQMTGGRVSAKPPGARVTQPMEVFDVTARLVD